MKPLFSQFVGALALGIVFASSACAQEFDPAADTGDTEEWLHAPLTPGEYEYHDEGSESLALFGDADPVHLFVMRCEKSSGTVGIARRGDADSEVAMTIRAEAETRTTMAQQVPGYGLIAISLQANDPLLDAIAVTRGRFAVEVQGFETLYLPPRGEAIRVIEDCR